MRRLYFEIPYKIKEGISDSELLELHKRYWTFISENGLDYKPDIFCENGKYAGIMNSCFLCEYAFRQRCRARLKRSPCFYCPVKSFRSNHCEYYPSPYNEWATTEDSNKREYLALQIAYLEMDVAES